MRILLVNDDGVFSPGLHALAEAAKQFGEVTVLAPDRQCSAMSMKITIFEELRLRREPDFPVEGVEAWSLSGTPADCVKIALNYLLPEKPDWVFSGVNNGFNTGVDILYSGTIGAAMEALSKGIPAAAFSQPIDEPAIPDRWLTESIAEILAQPKDLQAVWNINFPAGGEAGLKGIRRDLPAAPVQLFSDTLHEKHYEDGSIGLCQRGVPIRPEDAPEGTDVHAVLHGYIAIGKVGNAITLQK